jgi:hypothetical protein
LSFFVEGEKKNKQAYIFSCLFCETNSSRMVRLPVADSNCSATVAFLYDGHTRHILHDSKEGGLCSANRKKQTISIAIHRAITIRSSLQLFVLAVVSAIHNGICLEDSPTFTIDSMHKCFQKKIKK